VFHFAVASVVAFHFVFNSFYRDNLDPTEVWGILDWPIAAAILVALFVNYQRKRQLENTSDKSVTRDYVEASVLSFATAFLALLFFSNWFNFLNVGVEGETAVNGMIWALVDALVVLVLAATGRRLWRSTSG
jgi:hypothetical protein